MLALGFYRTTLLNLSFFQVFALFLPLMMLIAIFCLFFSLSFSVPCAVYGNSN